MYEYTSFCLAVLHVIRRNPSHLRRKTMPWPHTARYGSESVRYGRCGYWRHWSRGAQKIAPPPVGREKRRRERGGDPTSPIPKKVWDERQRPSYTVIEIRAVVRVEDGEYNRLSVVYSFIITQIEKQICWVPEKIVDTFGLERWSDDKKAAVDAQFMKTFEVVCGNVGISSLAGAIILRGSMEKAYKEGVHDEI